MIDPTSDAAKLPCTRHQPASVLVLCKLQPQLSVALLAYSLVRPLRCHRQDTDMAIAGLAMRFDSHF
jgi:hypothetical protein